MVTINIEKRDLFLLSAIVVFIVGTGIVIAYNSGTSPSVFGHSWEEVEKDFERIYCAKTYRGLERAQYTDLIQGRNEEATCPAGKILIYHGIDYAFGQGTDWNNNQHKTWAVEGDYANNKIICKVYGTDVQAAIGGVGLCA